MSSESPTNANSFTVEACLVKSGTLSDVLQLLWDNLQRLSDSERPEVLRTLVDRVSQKVEWSFVTRPSQQRCPGSKAINADYDGSEPLSHPGHEATAQFMSSLKSERDCANVTALAQSLGVSRKTIYFWKNNPRVLQRMQYLTGHRKQQGDLIGRVAWTRIMQAMVREAAAGDVAAAKFVAERAWPAETRTVEDLLAPYREPKENDNAHK